MLDDVVRAVDGLDAALPQQADDLDRLLEHLEALLGERPVVAEDALVQRLAAAEPSRNRPGMRVAVVAAAWAMIAGCVRTVGHVTAVTHPIVLVAAARPPSTAHTNGLWPCSSFQGWKWSEIQPA